jgi:hypothetical protein
MNEFLELHDIIHYVTPPYSPQYEGGEYTSNLRLYYRFHRRIV